MCVLECIVCCISSGVFSAAGRPSYTVMFLISCVRMASDDLNILVTDKGLTWRTKAVFSLNT